MYSKSSIISVLFLSIMFVSGCSPKATKLSSEGYSDTHLIECGGLINSFGDCVKKAKEMCPNGYDVLSATHHNGSGATFGTDNSTGLLVGGESRSMLVKCK